MEPHLQKLTVKGPADWFTGDVWIDDVAEGHASSPFSAAFVRFSPGARTAWHSHSVGQTLFVVEGEGRVQSRGQSPVSIHAGQVVFAPAGEWHWHGAASDHFMTHLAISEGEPEWGRARD